MHRATIALAAAACSTPALAGSPPNLVINGDFEDPALSGVNSDYINTPNGNIDEGTWWVSPWQPGGPWSSAQHLPGSQGKMNVNGDNSTSAGIKRVWYQTVDVTPGIEHTFELYALSTGAGCGGYSLELAVDGVAVSDVFCPAGANVFVRHGATFTPSSTAVSVSVRNVSGITFPNDFILDDIAVFANTPAPCNAADLADPRGLLDLADITAFVDAFVNQQDPADLALPDGLFDLADITAFVAEFTAGCQ